MATYRVSTPWHPYEYIDAPTPEEAAAQYRAGFGDFGEPPKEVEVDEITIDEDGDEIVVESWDF